MGQRIYESCSTHLLQSESELEKSFWLRASKTHGTFDCVDSQRQIGPYRAEAYYEINGHRLDIELDGGSYHDATTDNQRDSFMLKNGLVDEIVRIPFAAMFHYRDATFAVLEKWIPQFSSELPIDCISFEEFFQELAQAKQRIEIDGRYLDFFNTNEFIEWADDFYEIFDELLGFACSVKTALKAVSDVGWQSSRLKPIRRRKRISRIERLN